MIVVMWAFAIAAVGAALDFAARRVIAAVSRRRAARKQAKVDAEFWMLVAPLFPEARPPLSRDREES